MREIIYFFYIKKGCGVQFIVNKIKNRNWKNERINDMLLFVVYFVLVVQMNVRVNYIGIK